VTVELTTLPNGVRVVTEYMPGLASVALGIWVGAGGRHESPEQNGIAHFLEHMAFKGTTTRSPQAIAEAIEDVGGYINAYTSREVTAYYTRVLGEHTALALDVIADIVLNPIFEPREIETERHVILQEIGQAADTPDDIIFDWLQEQAYPDQALGRSILGASARVAGFGRDDLARFVEEHYGPEQLIVSAAGAVDHDTVVAQAEALFGALASRPARAPQPAQFAGSEARTEKALEQAHVAMAFEAPGYRDPAFYTAQIYTTALGGGMSSRLFQELREKRGLCYSIFAQSGAYHDTGLTTIYAGTSGDEVADLLTLTVDEMARVADDFSEAELNRARAQMKAGLLMGLESPASRAERMARMVQIWGKVPALESTVAKIDAVRVSDVRAFAARTVGQANPALALYGPVSRAPQLADLTARRAA
jgi:predicted Zn-dependent peptidase